jgi:hypothetical protein
MQSGTRLSARRRADCAAYRQRSVTRLRADEKPGHAVRIPTKAATDSDLIAATVPI